MADASDKNAATDAPSSSTKTKDSLNALSEADINTIWLPKVIYENTDQKETTRLNAGKWETRIIVKREQAKGTLSGPESIDETEIFSGFDNSLVMNQTYTRTFQCNYQFFYYLFDTQVNDGFRSLCNQYHVIDYVQGFPDM